MERVTIKPPSNKDQDESKNSEGESSYALMPHALSSGACSGVKSETIGK